MRRPHPLYEETTPTRTLTCVVIIDGFVLSGGGARGGETVGGTPVTSAQEVSAVLCTRERVGVSGLV